MTNMKNSIKKNLDEVIDETGLSKNIKIEAGEVKNYSLLKQHPQFAESYNALHARPFFVSTTPLSISHVAFLHQNRVSHQEELSHLNTLCFQFNIESPNVNDLCFYQNFGEFELRWERHTEFSSYTFIIPKQQSTPFDSLAINLLPNHWLNTISGEMIAAVHIDMLAVSDNSLNREYLRTYFEGERLIGSELRNNDAIIWSAFRLHEDNFNRILIFNNMLNECQSGRVLRALLELETYRNMSLLAFPLAQKISAKVSELEIELARLIRKLEESNQTDDEKSLLDELSKMAAEIAELIAFSRYRLDASCAYYEMVQSRLKELEENEIDKIQTMATFIERRLTPSHRTVQAAKRRLDDLSQRVDRASDFLRTRINMVIEAQNQALLKSMNRRAQMQFSLQETVESLSVVVISYYVLSLFQYLLSAINTFGFRLYVDRVTAILMPIVLAAVWFLTRRLKKRLQRTNPG
mgnify:CR=1 FL=1